MKRKSQRSALLFDTSQQEVFARDEMRATMPPVESSDSLTYTLYILSRLQSGWRPSPDNLEDAPLIERWRITDAAPYMMRGAIDGHRASGAVYAIDASAGWARLIDRWVRLGTPALPDQQLPENDTVMRCAAIALMLDSHPDVGATIRALAANLRDRGLAMVAYLLEIAALEADAARWPQRLAHIGDDAAALTRRGSERKARRPRERTF
jgi:hypothetical protein